MLIAKLNEKLINKEVVIVEHTLDNYGDEFMHPHYGAMTHPATIDARHARPGDVNVLIPVGDNHGILVPNSPVIHEGVDHPSGVDFHSDHVKIRYTQLCDTHSGRMPVKTYFTITAFRALDDE